MSTVLEQTAEVPSLEFISVIHEGVPCKVKDLPACIKFYQDVLGLKLLPQPKALDDIGQGALMGDAGNRMQLHLIAKDDEYALGAEIGCAPGRAPYRVDGEGHQRLSLPHEGSWRALFRDQQPHRFGSRSIAARRRSRYLSKLIMKPFLKGVGALPS